MENRTENLRWLGVGSRALVFLLLVYWGAFALLAPVTTWDSHVYNLGRLSIAERGGLFNNPFWTSVRQLIFPWTFDAAHLPFVYFGWGFGIPSYLCLLGTVFVAWSLLKRWHGDAAAWVGCLALMGLPTLVFQGVGTKNDIPIVFGVAVWLHALLAWKKEPRFCYLFFAACSIGFVAGVKTSGILSGALCGTITLVLLRKRFSAALTFVSLSAVSLALLGSGETYFASYHKYGEPLGPPDFVQIHQNRDGLRGGVANGIRYIMENVNSGMEAWEKPDRLTPRLEEWCREILSEVGLEDAGYRNPGFDDANMHFLKMGYDSVSDFGPLGTICLMVLALAVFWWQPRELWWQLSIFAGITAAGLCYSIAWMPWNNRFLVLPFASLAVALVSLAARSANNRPWQIIAVAGIAAYSAIVYPLLSFNKRPRDLFASVAQRQHQELRERPGMEPLMNTVRALALQKPTTPIWLLAGEDSWVFPLLNEPRLHVEVVTIGNMPAHLAQLHPGAPNPLLLVLNRPDFVPDGFPFELVQTFPEEDMTALYEYVPPIAGTRPPKITRTRGYDSDGWTGCSFAVGINYWTTRDLILKVWNPTSLVRQVSLRTSQEETQFELKPQETRLVHLKVKRSESLLGTVTPPFIPGGAETRQLGIHLTISIPGSAPSPAGGP